MQRDLDELSNRVFDLLVIGGGIHGAWVAFDAALRGLDVSLIDAGDFAGETSSNSLKVIHGGLRYLQSGDIGRMRESIRERSTLLRVAPHLVRPLPFVLPLYGHGSRGPEAMRMALWVTDAVGADRNRGVPIDRTLSPSRVVSADECRELIPGVDSDGLTGGAVWYDALVYSDARLVLDVVKAANAHGAVIANYANASGLSASTGNVHRVRVRDTLMGSEFDVRARAVVNATGPWAHCLDREVFGVHHELPSLYAKSFNLAVPRLFEDVGAGFKSRSSEDGSTRYLFSVPYRDHTLIGTTQSPYRGSPSGWEVNERDIDEFLREFNAACPGADLMASDVKRVYAGLVSARRGSGPGSVELESQHSVRLRYLDGSALPLITVHGVKLTTARDVAEQAVDAVFAALGYRRPPSCRTAITPLAGAEGYRSGFVIDLAGGSGDPALSRDVIDHLVRTYGTSARAVIDIANGEPDLAQRLTQASPVLKAEVVYAVRGEMAQTADDVLVRRSGYALDRTPTPEVIEACEALLNRAKAPSLPTGDKVSRSGVVGMDVV